MKHPGFKHVCLPQLPPLGWHFEYDAKNGEKLICGASVCVYEKGFLEGCCATPAAEDDIVHTINIFGSGMQKSDGRWLFLTASHPLEALFLYRHSNGWCVSNSLPFLVAHRRLEIPWDIGYGAKFASISLGIDDYEKTLFRLAEGDIFRIVVDNVELESNGKFCLIRKPLPPPFPTFKTYTDYLRETLRLAFENASDKGYRPLATCSSGYDSACATALAAGLGCGEAITLKTARRGDNDSGKLVAEVMGMRVHEFERLETVSDFESVAEFLVTGTGGEDYCYRNFAPILPHRVLLTGFRGDKCWDANNLPDTVFGHADLSGCSLQEFRLWNDFIHIPVPTIGARRQPEIVAISSTAEMSSYRLHTDYDRPLPRRIVEDAGVSRTLFGQKKKAASILLFFRPKLFSPRARQECTAAVPRRWSLASKYGAAALVWEMRCFSYRMACFLTKRMPDTLRLPGILSLKNWLIPHWRIFEHSHPRSTLEFLSALHVVTRRYRKALDRLK